MTVMYFEHQGRRLAADLADPLPIAVPLDFDGPQPGFHGAPAAASRPLRGGNFIGDTREGGSCNCDQVTLVPHCNGTHTECVGHLTDDSLGFCKQLLADTGVAFNTGLDFDPVGGHRTIRISFAVSRAETAEAMKRFSAWLEAR